MRPLALAALAIALAGCGAPLAADQEPDRPSERVDVPPIPDLEGTLTVTSLPADQMPTGAGTGDIVNCFIVATDAEDLVGEVKAASVTLAWTPESPVADDLTLTVRSDKQAQASGPSPLKLEWTSIGGGPGYAPFLVQVAGETLVAQQVAFTVHVEGDGTRLEAYPSSCDA